MTDPTLAVRPSLVSQHPAIVAAHRRSSLSLALCGLAGVCAAPFYLAAWGFGWFELGLFALPYFLVQGVGLSVGFHRYFTHGAFRTSAPIERAMAILGCMGAQGPLTYWVAVHRRHHECSDREGDPHSPHWPKDGAGGLWHGHFGWSLNYGMPNATHYCPDLVKRRDLVWIGRHYYLWVLLGWLLPALVGFALSFSWQGALAGLLWGGLVRQFASSHSTWALNSICHRFGARPHKVRDQSRNNAWLALPTLGESWHNNHHAQPSSAAHGFHWWQVDLNYLFIRSLELVGLASGVKRPRI